MLQVYLREKSPIVGGAQIFVSLTFRVRIPHISVTLQGLLIMLDGRRVISDSKADLTNTAIIVINLFDVCYSG